MSDFTTPLDVNVTAAKGGGYSAARADIRSVTVRFDAPQFGTCNRCGWRIARLGDREQWHHVDRSVQHPAIPIEGEHARIAWERGGD